MAPRLHDAACTAAVPESDSGPPVRPPRGTAKPKLPVSVLVLLGGVLLVGALCVIITSTLRPFASAWFRASRDAKLEEGRGQHGWTRSFLKVNMADGGRSSLSPSSTALPQTFFELFDDAHADASTSAEPGSSRSIGSRIYVRRVFVVANNAHPSKATRGYAAHIGAHVGNYGAFEPASDIQPATCASGFDIATGKQTLASAEDKRLMAPFRSAADLKTNKSEDLNKEQPSARHKKNAVEFVDIVVRCNRAHVNQEWFGRQTDVALMRFEDTMSEYRVPNETTRERMWWREKIGMKSKNWNGEAGRTRTLVINFNEHDLVRPRQPHDARSSSVFYELFDAALILKDQLRRRVSTAKNLNGLLFLGDNMSDGARTDPKLQVDVGTVSRFDHVAGLRRWWAENDHTKYHNGPSSGLVAAAFVEQLLRKQAQEWATWLLSESDTGNHKNREGSVAGGDTERRKSEKRAYLDIAKELREYRIVLLGFSFQSEDTDSGHNWALERQVVASGDLKNVFLC